MAKTGAETKLADADAALRAGDLPLARRRLLSLRRARLSRAQKLEMARLSLRLSLPEISLSLLRSIVYPAKPLHPPATVEEIAQYAAALTRLGANQEATQLLKGLPDMPSVLLFRAFALIKEWNYHAAIPVLKRYLEQPALSRYDRLVGNVNLAGALVHVRDPGALPLLEDLEREVSEQGFGFGLGMISILLAEEAIHRREWTRGKSFLLRAGKIVTDAKSLEHLFVRLWLSVIQMNEDGDAGPIEAIKHEALERGHWETIRNCDYHLALYRQDESLFLKVYFGTPFPEKRESLVKLFPREVSIPDQYSWEVCPGPGGAKVWDLESPKLRQPLKSGMVLHRLVLALQRDFYSPRTVPQLFGLLFPDEHFNPATAPGRVRQAVNRLRSWLKLNRSPFGVEERDGAYRFVAKPGHALHVSRPLSEAGDRDEILLARLRKTLEAEMFRSREAGKALNLGKTETARFLQSSLERGHIERLGSSSATKYRFKRVRA